MATAASFSFHFFWPIKPNYMLLQFLHFPDKHFTKVSVFNTVSPLEVWEVTMASLRQIVELHALLQLYETYFGTKLQWVSNSDKNSSLYNYISAKMTP